MLNEEAPTPTDDNAVFVSVTGPDDGDGSRAKPLRNLSHAILFAHKTNPKKVVFLSEGFYRGRFLADVSLFGGFDESFSQREPKSFITTLEAEGEPPWESRANATVYVTGGTQITLSGLCIVGPGEGASTSEGINAQDKEKDQSCIKLSIIDCVIYGGSAHNSVGVHSRGDLYVKRSLISGGDGDQSSVGLSTSGGEVEIFDSIIRGGNAPSSLAFSSTSSFLLEGCTIEAQGGKEASHGISVKGSAHPTIKRCNVLTQLNTSNRRPMIIGESCGVEFQETSLDGEDANTIFAKYQNLSEETWNYDESSDGRVWNAVTLNKSGYLRWYGEDLNQLVGDFYDGPEQSIEDFLQTGPPWKVPTTIHASILNALQKGGFTIPETHPAPQE